MKSPDMNFPPGSTPLIKNCPIESSIPKNLQRPSPFFSARRNKLRRRTPLTMPMIC